MVLFLILSVSIRIMCNCYVKAWFHDSEILREKLFMRNTDGCTWTVLLNSLTCFAFAVSRTDFYSLAKRNFFSRIENSMELFTCNHPYFACFSWRISLPWNQALTLFRYIQLRYINAKSLTAWNELESTSVDYMLCIATQAAYAHEKYNWLSIPCAQNKLYSLGCSHITHCKNA